MSGDQVRILKATSVEYYHSVPGDLELLTVNPEQEAIFQYLSMIDPDRFQNFVADVLVLAEGHRLVDVTGGPGDEKQDILTESPDGHRQLTQCKHTVNYATKSNGDELDLLFGAAFRKNCKATLYVTNGDLTPQAKRYVNDREYMRGSSADPAAAPTMEYWNGRRIWERIASNNPILNKWFSGAAQVHALRSASVRLITTAMPDRSVLESDPESVVSAFKALSTPFDLTVDGWFSSARDVPGSAGALPLNAPVPALKAQISAPSDGSFDIDSAIKSLATATLSSSADTAGWLHLHVSNSTSVFFTHDLRKPIVCEVGAARSFVKVGDQIEDEFTWSFDPGTGFLQSEDGYLSWTQEAMGNEWNVSVGQPIAPHEAYAIALRQQQLTRSASEFKFWRLGFTQRNLELLQSLPTVRGMILLQGKEHLLFAVPDGEWAGEQLESFCLRNQVPFEILTDELRGSILSNIEQLPVSESKWVSQVHELESPIDLTQRVVSLHRVAKFGDQCPPLTKLLKYKWEYEVRHGFDALMGAERVSIGSEELLGRLFDIYTVRGNHMLDIAPGEDGALMLQLRRTDVGTFRASDIASELLDEMRQVEDNLHKIATKDRSPVVDATPSEASS